ncbi:methyl-accepting chemotaxis protein [Agarivorans sp. TSD2052]|uniref:methyl-accepting chemotaxis protein n=1 Tax=Agarivorans sp. TSD2052 TaxID=2937286 RepID=UPI002010970F|nr:methyl-accepting chemotaxis protein [Agarivorans sp. TSD2052]UPW20302.1 methyl-accepting chemotaxis protein [Agarivorans sp. TSD2052]
MSSIFSPAVYLSDRISFKYKFILWTCLFLIPIAYGFSSIIITMNSDLEFAEQELAGYKVVSQLPSLSKSIVQHQHLNTLRTMGAEFDKAELSALQQGLDGSLSQLSSVLPSNLLPALEQVSQRWKTVRDSSSSLGQLLIEHEALLREIRGLTHSVAANSGLTRDPIVTSYYLIDITVDRLPALQSNIARIRDKGGDIADFGILDAEGNADLRFRTDNASEVLNDMRKALSQLSTYDQQFEQKLGSDAALTIQSIEQIVSLIRDEILKDQQVKTNTQTVFATANQSLQQIEQFTEAALNYFGEELTQRTQNAENKRIIMLLALVFVLLVCSYFMIGAYLSVRRTVKQIRFVAARVNQGDLSQDLMVYGSDELADIAQDYKTTLNALRNLLQQVTSSSEEMLTATQQIGDKSQEVREAINQQQQETQQIATAVAEMNATVNSMADDANKAADSTLASQQAVVNGQQIVGNTISTIGLINQEVLTTSDSLSQLQEQTGAIGGVIDVIKNIAEQTNLLALNAAIEAARAGEQGRGFAVVADEVRTLASRTQTSTAEIQRMIENLQSGSLSSVNAMANASTRAQSGVEQAEEARDSFSHITQGVDEVVELNTNIASAIEQQSKVMDEVEHNIVQISDGANAALFIADEASKAGESIRFEVDKLNQLIERYQL